MITELYDASIISGLGRGQIKFTFIDRATIIAEINTEKNIFYKKTKCKLHFCHVPVRNTWFNFDVYGTKPADYIIKNVIEYINKNYEDRFKHLLWSGQQQAYKNNIDALKKNIKELTECLETARTKLVQEEKFLEYWNENRVLVLGYNQ